MSRGDGGLEKWTDERQPNSGRVELTKWRSEVESKVLSSMFTTFPPKDFDSTSRMRTDYAIGKAVHGIVIRPGILYGRSGSLPGMMVFQAAEAAKQKGEKFEAIGVDSARMGTIHQDDLADLYVRVAERVSLLVCISKLVFSEYLTL